MANSFEWLVLFYLMLVSHEARLKAEDVRKGGEGGGREG